MSTPVKAQERIVSLIVALMASSIGLTKEQILTTVSGYRGTGAKQDALERMFERDKDELRRLGVPIHTIGEESEPDDLREARYRIPKAEYVLPEDITFTPAEIAVLNLAGQVWGEESIGGDAQSALRKIRALGIDVDEPIIGFAPRVNLRDPAFSPLRTASEQHRIVRFAYVKPGDEQARLRRIAPLALIDYEARWHVYGIDLDIDQERTFLLSRIVGDVEVTRSDYDAALAEGAGIRAREGLDEVAQRNQAVLEVTENTEASLRLRRRGTADGTTLSLPFVDVHVLADELASYGPEVRVIEPAELRAQVIERLRRVVSAHEAGAT